MKDYDNNKENIFIMYLYANSLYGWAMTQYLPYGNFKWLTKGQINKFNLALIVENNSDGYTLEVDLEYPNDVHNVHNDYPLAPGKLKISKDMLSGYCYDIADKYGIKFDKINKLVPNLGNKEKYGIHYKNLQLYLLLGMKVTKVHRILKFKQPDCLKKFVDFNTEKRKNAAIILKKNSLN